MNRSSLTRRSVAEGPQIHGLEDAREGVFKFLSDTIGSVKTDVILVQLFQHGFQAGEPFYQFEVDARGDDIQKISDDIVDAAEQDIASCGSHKILYSVKLANHNGRKNFPLSIKGNGGGSGFGEVNEAEMIPTLRHIASQQMQHNEALIQTTVGSFGAQMKMMAKQNIRLQERIEYLESEREKYIESREAVLSHQHERDIKARQQEKSDFRMDQLTSTAINALAPIVNKYVKQKIIPEKATPIEGMMIALASTMTAEQIQALISSGLFTPAQLTNFMQIFQTIHDSFESEKKSHEEQINGALTNT